MAPAVETVQLRGHIIDSLLLPKVLDEIIARDGRFEILELHIGRQRQMFDPAAHAISCSLRDMTLVFSALR